MRKLMLKDKTIPCLICDVELDICLFPDSSAKDIETAPIDGGIECRTHGNYGSRVHDLDGVLFFALCDECTLKHASKMIHKSRDGLLTNGKDHFDKNQEVIDEYYRTHPSPRG